MRSGLLAAAVLAAATLITGPVLAADEAAYAQAIKNFRDQPATAPFFRDAVGYAVFPTIGKGGVGIGGAYGKGRVYEQGKHVGNTSMAQVSIGFQFGGQAYSQIVFFEDKRAFDEFTSGNFEFSAQASAVALTSGVAKDAAYSDGVAVFTIEKGGLMYEASIGGQKFSFDPL